MKCPKCGFNSFDYLDSCKKCGNDLAEFKAKHGLRSLLFPGKKPGREEVVLPEEADTPEEALLTEATAPTDFGFGFMDEPEQDAATAAPGADEDRDVPAEGIALSGELNFDEAEEGFGLEGQEETDLPPLETGSQELPAFDEVDDFSFFDSPAETEEPPGEDVELPSWDELEEESADRKPAERKEPSDPFEQREPAAAGRVPENFTGQNPGPDTELPAEVPAADFSSVAASTGDSPDPSTIAAVVAECFEQLPGDTALPSLPDPPAADQLQISPPASLVGRLGALLADLLLVGSVLGGFLLLGQLLLEPQHAGMFPDPLWLLRLSVPYFLLVFLGCFGYFTLFHLLLGQTPGKMLFGLGVETLDGLPLSPAQAFLRSVGGLAGWCLGGLGHLSILFDAAGRGWNDRLAGTRVVSWEEALPAPSAEGAGPEVEVEG